ncbi:MAG: hydrogenase 4 membrane subunit [Coriobacteriia bacterium]|nr:hydrogenase 4 membrane subunit [Coriobacteriia bacterium]
MSGYIIVNILSTLLILTSLVLILAKSPRKAAYIYGTQALVLVAILITLGSASGAHGLYTWSITAFITKVILVPAILLFALKKMKPQQEDMPPRLAPTVTVALTVVIVVLCVLVVSGITLPTALEVKPALAVSLALFFIGITCIISQRSIIKQIFGFCLMENGSHVSLALLAPEAPMLVEIGIATDAVLVVIVMVIMATRMYRTIGTLDANEITKLRG